MKNISNQHIDANQCTYCTNCFKPSWYVMECDCGNMLCKNCSVKDEDDNYESNAIMLICPKCGRSTMYV